ncbi:hypothetical protein [Saccharopolyspora hattusasensis]|uniref:hypothetical protein n=1 Tax=Saccharopolyspora hattusasensis TaxID=1128679 RepID=UPI003D987E78
MVSLSGADRRTRDPKVRELATKTTIPHPLNNVQYADGISKCCHAKKHQRFQRCPQQVRPS